MKPETKLTKAIHLISQTGIRINMDTFEGNWKKSYLANERLEKAARYLSLVKKQLKAKQ